MMIVHYGNISYDINQECKSQYFPNCTMSCMMQNSGGKRTHPSSVVVISKYQKYFFYTKGKKQIIIISISFKNFPHKFTSIFYVTAYLLIKSFSMKKKIIHLKDLHSLLVVNRTGCIFC